MWNHRREPHKRSKTSFECRNLPYSFLVFLVAAWLYFSCHRRRRRRRFREPVWNSEKATTKMSNLLSNQWISYDSWMLFKQIFTACFLLFPRRFHLFFHLMFNFTFASIVIIHAQDRLDDDDSRGGREKLLYKYFVYSTTVEHKINESMRASRWSLFTLPYFIWDDSLSFVANYALVMSLISSVENVSRNLWIIHY